MDSDRRRVFRVGGARQVVLEPPAAIYHQPHSRAELAGRARMPDSDFVAWRRQQLAAGRPELSNGPRWGRHAPSWTAAVPLVFEPL